MARTFVEGSALLAMAAFACTNPASSAPPEPNPAIVNVQKNAASLAPDPDAATIDPEAAVRPVTEPDAGANANANAGETAHDYLDPHAWLLGHAMVDEKADEQDLTNGACHPVKIGPQRTDALACDSREAMPKLSSPEGETVFPFVLADVDPSKRTLRTLFKVPLVAGSLAEPLEYVHLAATIASDGMSVTIVEPSEGTCAAATKKWREYWHDPSERAIQADYLKTIASVCRARGTYEWRNGRFTRHP